ncbi:hypothetical protein IWX49DRAFT_498998 [Phyllosticta citricarpa]|uniref:Tail specific protease domain-containing protein n=1 Tax=Phyllosticta paracitricarpa TaxID=2016321 RepID=A0ABR1NED4_9PEZI
MFVEAAVFGAVLLGQAAAAPKSISGSGIPASISAPATITGSQTIQTGSATYSQPCAEVSKSFDSLIAASDTPLIGASLGYECLKSVPVDKSGDQNLIEEISEIMEWQSTLAYIKNPPKGYENAAVDILAGLKNISDTVAKGGYSGDYDVQLDITNLLNKAYDGHLTYLSDIAGILLFGRVGRLVSVSNDGSAVPQVFLFEDLKQTHAGAKFTPSAVKTINGRPANDYLNDLANQDGGFHDPDARYNNLFFNIAKQSYGAPDQMGSFAGLTGTAAYDGATTELVHENGTKTSIQNIAVINADFTNVTSGASFFDKFCSGNDNTLDLSSLASSASSSASASVPTATGYPWPVHKTSDDIASGYFLNDTGYQNVAILSIPSFMPTTDDGTEDFQSVVRQFLADAVSAGKKYLIVDLRANGGGATELGYDLFKQLFPNMEPYGGTRWRANSAFNAMGQVTTAWADSKLIANNKTLLEAGLLETGVLISEFWVNSSLNANNQDFANWADLYGPHVFNSDNFTSIARTNFSDPFSYGDDEFSVTGYENNTKVSAQPFAAENIVLLQDGYCSSTCAIFTELAKSQGAVKQVAIGGRPQTGPMQGVGGTKGAETISWDILAAKAATVSMLAATRSSLNLLTNSGVDTLANLTQVFIRAAGTSQGLAAAINYRDNLRPGDDSQTPLQFVNEPAECRMWYTAPMLFDPTVTWRGVYDVMWGKGQCVKDSVTNGSAANSSSNGHKKNAAPAVGANAMLGFLAAALTALFAL